MHPFYGNDNNTTGSHQIILSSCVKSCPSTHAMPRSVNRLGIVDFIVKGACAMTRCVIYKESKRCNYSNRFLTKIIRSRFAHAATSSPLKGQVHVCLVYHIAIFCIFHSPT